MLKFPKLEKEKKMGLALSLKRPVVNLNIQGLHKK